MKKIKSAKISLAIQSVEKELQELDKKAYSLWKKLQSLKREYEDALSEEKALKRWVDFSTLEPVLYGSKRWEVSGGKDYSADEVKKLLLEEGEVSLSVSWRKEIPYGYVDLVSIKKYEIKDNKVILKEEREIEYNKHLRQTRG